jgi:hypothetical protein
MVLQLFIGTLAVTVTVVLSATMIWIASRILSHMSDRLAQPPYALKTIVIVSAITLWLMGAMSVSIWVWALFFWGLDIFTNFEPALYFASVSFTTLGFGDILLPVEWRLLSGICAANGLILFGLSAAYLFELFSRLHAAHVEHRRRMMEDQAV